MAWFAAIVFAAWSKVLAVFLPDGLHIENVRLNHFAM
jgi:hypothetical protein